jgi:hypothetical protein
VGDAGHLVYRLLGEPYQMVVEGDGLYLPEALPLDRAALLRATLSLASFAFWSMSASTSGSRARWSREVSHQPLNAVTMAG